MNQLSWPFYFPVWLFALTLKTVVLSFANVCSFLLSWELVLKYNIYNTHIVYIIIYFC